MSEQRGARPGRRVVRLLGAADVADEQQVSDLYNRVRSDDASVLDTSLEAWQRVQDVDLKSVFLCCKHGIPHLLENGGGSVINTAPE